MSRWSSAARCVVDLGGGGVASRDERIGDLPGVGPLECPGCRVGDREVRLGTDVDETERAQLSRQVPTEGEIDSPLGEQGDEGGTDLVRPPLVGRSAGRGKRLRAAQCRSPRSRVIRRAKGAGHAPECQSAFGYAGEDHRACTRSNVSAGGGLRRRCARRRRPRGVPGRPVHDVDVGGNHGARRADPVRQPDGHGRAAGTDLPATPPVGDAERRQCRERGAVETGRQGGGVVVGFHSGRRRADRALSWSSCDQFVGVGRGTVADWHHPPGR